MNEQFQNKRQLQPVAIGWHALAGGVIGLVLITAFLVTAGEPDPAWPKLYWVRPVIIVPVAAAGGAVFFYMMKYFGGQGGWKKALGYILGVIGFIIALWIGTVLGLDGTYWN